MTIKAIPFHSILFYCIVDGERGTQGLCICCRSLSTLISAALISFLSVVHYTSLSVTPSVIPWRERFVGAGAASKQSASPLRRDEEKARRRERRRRRVFQQRQSPPGGSNETEGKKNRRRNAVSLTTQCKHDSPRPPLGPAPEAASAVDKMLSEPGFCSITQMFGSRSANRKKPLSGPFRGR